MFETDERKEIACVFNNIQIYCGRRPWVAVADTKTSQEGKRTILTVKSLILAQDER